MIRVIPQFVPKEPFRMMVSSGLDSIAAAHWLKHHYHKKFTIVHFNHSVQHLNDKMEHFVSEFGKDFDIECHYEYRWHSKWSDTSENGLREWRLSEMKKIGGKFATAHHLDDCVENFLQRTFSGNPEHKPIKEFTQFDGFSIYHPFLKTTKEDFINYVNDNDLLKYVVEDPTNKETTCNRNWLRNVVIPEISTRINLQSVVRKKFYNHTNETP
jgi:tRNA(Ile)-lysidine synthetase-like protein